MKKFFIILIVLLLLTAGIFYVYRQEKTSIVSNETNERLPDQVPLTVTTTEVQEENYSGTKPVIAGTGPLAAAARAYVESRIAEFEVQANADVPAMRGEFGADSPAASYTIDMNASHQRSDRTESVIISEYVYTGGAHGSSSYKTLTVSAETGKLVSLADIIREGERENFASLVKEKLLAWRPAGSAGEPVVFEEEVANLKFEDFLNWSLDEENLVLYFSQYEVGPGVLGAFPFPIPLAEIRTMLQ